MSSTHYPSAIANGVDIESIVRRVLHEVMKSGVVSQKPTASRSTTFVFDHRVITLSDIDGVPAVMNTIELPAGGIVTPAVRDVLRSRGISVTHTASKAVSGQDAKSGLGFNNRSPFRPIHLRHDESIDAALLGSVKNQLSSRGINLCDQASSSVMLSSRPASAVYRCITENMTAVSINRIDDVIRFKKELKPSVYVLDVLHLNLISLVNAIVQIARRDSQFSGNQAGDSVPVVTVAGGQK